MAKRTVTTYPAEFKAMVVHLYLDGKGSYRELTKQFDLKDTKTLRSWVKKYTQGNEIIENLQCDIESSFDVDGPTFSSVEEELAHVKAERDFLKKVYRSRFGVEWRAGQKAKPLKR